MAHTASSPAREAIRGTVPKLAEIADTLIYGQIWEGPHLSKRDRSLIVCGALMAMGRDVKDDAEGEAVARVQAADAVAHRHLIETARAGDRAAVDREQHGIALAQ